MKASILVPLVFGIFTKISATPLTYDSNTNLCDGAVTLVSTWVGEGKNVELKSVFCPNSHQHVLGQQAVPPVSPNSYQHVLEQQSIPPPVNVCGAPCATNCFTPAGGGPDPNDCHVIADALRFESQSIDPLFIIGIKTSNTIVLKYNSCSTFFLNQSPTILEYCRVDWASLIDFVAFNCQATQNAHGGLCVANNKGWFVQVNHV